MARKDGSKMDKKKVAFICVHNSCRSQIAEALGKHFAADKYDFYSAGTETKPQINQDAVRLMKQLYGIDMERTVRLSIKSQRLIWLFLWVVMSAVRILAELLMIIGAYLIQRDRVMMYLLRSSSK